MDRSPFLEGLAIGLDLKRASLRRPWPNAIHVALIVTESCEGTVYQFVSRLELGCRLEDEAWAYVCAPAAELHGLGGIA